MMWRGWWDGVVVVVVVVWPSSWKHKAWGGGLGQKPETSPLGLGLGCTIENSSGGRWGQMVGWCGQGYGGGGVACWAAQARVAGFGLAIGNSSGGRLGDVVGWCRRDGGGGVYVHSSMHKGGGGPRAKKNRKLSQSGLVSGLQEVEGDSVVSQGPLLWYPRWWLVGSDVW
jgi:hypothetical protein